VKGDNHFTWLSHICADRTQERTLIIGLTARANRNVSDCLIPVFEWNCKIYFSTHLALFYCSHSQLKSSQSQCISIFSYNITKEILEKSLHFECQRALSYSIFNVCLSVLLSVSLSLLLSLHSLVHSLYSLNIMHNRFGSDKRCFWICNNIQQLVCDCVYMFVNL
jgi:hypothetical protein